MQNKRDIALQIALQTHVLEICPVHHEIYTDDDADPSSAFALAVDLVRQHTACVIEFEHDPHALTDLLSEIIGAAPTGCPGCAALRERGRERARVAADAGWQAA